MLTELAGASALDHPLLVERESPKRAAVLVVSSDRGGLCGGAYNANVLRQSEELFALLRDEGKTPVIYAVGRKALGYYSFRQREVKDSWTGFSERPTYEQAREIADVLVAAFMAGVDDDDENAGDDGILGVDEIHIVFTQFKSMLSQSAVALRIAPMVIEYVGEQENDGPQTLFSFEPNAEALFDALLPRYIATRVYSALLEAAASESASRRRAMKSATDNADDLIKALTLEPTASARLRSPRKSARSSVAPTRSPTPSSPTHIPPGSEEKRRDNDCHRRRFQDRWSRGPHHRPGRRHRIPAWLGARAVQRAARRDHLRADGQDADARGCPAPR